MHFFLSVCVCLTKSQGVERRKKRQLEGAVIVLVCMHVCPRGKCKDMNKQHQTIYPEDTGTFGPLQPAQGINHDFKMYPHESYITRGQFLQTRCFHIPEVAIKTCPLQFVILSSSTTTTQAVKGRTVSPARSHWALVNQYYNIHMMAV